MSQNMMVRYLGVGLYKQLKTTQFIFDTSMDRQSVDDIHPLVLTICCSTSACCSVEDPLWLPQMDVMLLLLLLLLLISITIYGALGHVTPLGLAHVHQFGNFY